MPERSQRLMLLDTASLYFRAYFGVPDSIRSPDGMPVNAVRGLLDFISRLVGDYQPTHLACCWDNDWRPPGGSSCCRRTRRTGSWPTPKTAPDIEEVPDPLEPQIPIIVDVPWTRSGSRSWAPTATRPTT